MSNWQWIIILVIAVIGAILFRKRMKIIGVITAMTNPFINVESVGNVVNGMI